MSFFCYIHASLGETGVSPSFEEMKEALDLKSKSGVHRLISALEERGFIRRLPNRARALEVLDMPEMHRAVGCRKPGGNVIPPAPPAAAARQRHHRDAAPRPHRRRHADRGARRATESSRSPPRCSARASITRSKSPAIDGRGRHIRR